MKYVVGLDTETDDPCLGEKLGASWAYNKGSVLCTSLYYESSKQKAVLRSDGGEEVRRLLTDVNCILVGANIIYDLGWLCWSHRLKATDIKATLIDVLIAESHIDEYADIRLETCAQKYLHAGKNNARVEAWIKSQSFYKGGDFRKYLKYAPWDLLVEYAADDASLPCEVWREQCKILEAEQDRFYYDDQKVAAHMSGYDQFGGRAYKKFFICRCRNSPLTRVYNGMTYTHVSNYDPAAKNKLAWIAGSAPMTAYQKQETILKGTIYPVFVDFALIPIMLRAKQDGVKLDVKQKKINAAYLRGVHETLHNKFVSQYGEINTKSSKQKAAFFDRMGYPYMDRITIKTVRGAPVSYETLRETCSHLSRGVMNGFRVEKGKIVLYEDHAYSARAVSLINAAGATCICNPYIDKTVLSEMAKNEKYSVCATMVQLNKTKDILDKILGTEYDRFLGADNRIRADLNISKEEDCGTKTGRLSSSNPNLQQIPAHGELELSVEDGGDKIDISKLCRSLFLPDEGMWAHFDYPQIEFRLFVHYAVGNGAEELREKLRQNPHLDFHSIVAEITGLPRSVAKRITFGTLYGMGVAKLKKDFGYTDEEAEKVFASYFDNVPCVRSTMHAVSDAFIERGYLVTIGGRHFHIHSENESYKGINGLMQGSSADMTKLAIVKTNDRSLWDILNFHTTVHDELDFDVPETKEAVQAAESVAAIMSTVYELRVPVFVEPELGHNWFESSDISAADRFKELKEKLSA